MVRFPQMNLQQRLGKADFPPGGSVGDGLGELRTCPFFEELVYSSPILIGALAQLGERLVRNEEVEGSSPLCSTVIGKPAGMDHPADHAAWSLSFQD